MLSCLDKINWRVLASLISWGVIHQVAITSDALSSYSKELPAIADISYLSSRSRGCLSSTRGGLKWSGLLCHTDEQEDCQWFHVAIWKFPLSFICWPFLVTMEKVHVQKKKKKRTTNPNKCRTRKYFVFFKAVFFEFCLLLETSRFFSRSSSSQAWFPVNSETAPSSLEDWSASSSLQADRYSITGCLIRWWRHPIPAVLSHAPTSHPALQDPQLLFLSCNWPEKELITLQLSRHYVCVDFWPFYVYSQISQMAGPAEQITIKFTLQLLLSGGNWWAASKLLGRKDRWAEKWI